MSTSDIQRLLARQKDLIAKVWPGGMTAPDQVVLEAIPMNGRARILDRLEAAWRADQGAPLGPLAELAGLKRAAFYNLRLAWQRHSLAGLVPHDSRSARRVGAADDDPSRERAAALLRAEPVRRNVDIAKSIMDEDNSLVGDCAGPHDALTVLQRLERLVRDERRKLAHDPVFLQGAYGSGLVLDLSAVSIVIKGDEPALAVAAILMETASGLVMGSVLGTQESGLLLQRDALLAGLVFLEVRKADVPSSRVALPDLGVMLPSGVDAERVADALRPYVDQLIVGRIGGFSYGQQVVQVAGPRIGRISLRPRRTLSVHVGELSKRRTAPTATLHEARSIWAREVERHNADRIAALAEAGIVDGDLADGRLAVVIRALLSSLQPK